MISFVVTPFMLISNLWQYAKSGRLQEPSLAAMNAPVALDRPTPNYRGRWLKIIYGVLVWIGVGVFALQSAPRFLEKYSPALNASLHSGIPTTDADMDYRIDRLIKDMHSYNSMVDSIADNDSFKTRRSKLLAARPILEDIRNQYESMSAAWSAEKNDRSVPNDCEQPMEQYLSALNRWWSVEDRGLRVFRGIDPDSQDSIHAAWPQLKQITEQEDLVGPQFQRAAKQVAAAFSTAECKDY